MVNLFKKEDKGKKKTISESERSEIAKEAYKLGFEVGYHKHSELGWVTERFSHLDKFASERGLEEFVKAYYSRGRDDGVRSKERDIHSGLSKKGIGKKLVKHFEKEAIKLGAKEIKIRASLYATPFYQKIGYKKNV